MLDPLLSSASLTTWQQSAALLAAIKDYEASKWKVIGQKVGKPAKVRINGVRSISHEKEIHTLTHA